MHVYHQHVNPFQVLQIQRLPGSTYPTVDPDFIRIGEWRDSVQQISEPLTYLWIRTRPQAYEGVMVVHCHILDHEDMGMMALYNVSASC